MFGLRPKTGVGVYKTFLGPNLCFDALCQRVFIQATYTCQMKQCLSLYENKRIEDSSEKVNIKKYKMLL